MDEARTCTSILALQPDAPAAAALLETFDVYARACEYVCGVGRAAGTAGNARLHALCYHEVRARFGLTANLAVRAIARAAALLKLPERGAALAPDRIDYDPRVLSIAPGQRSVSIATIQGRCRDVRAVACDGRWPADGGFTRAMLLRLDASMLLLVWGRAGEPITPDPDAR